MKRFAAMVGVTALTGLALVGCSSDSGESGDAQTLTVTAFEEATWGEQLRFAADQYESEHPDVKIDLQFQPYEGYAELMQTQIVGGTATDIVQLEPPLLRTLSSSGQLADLDEALEGESEYGDGGTWAETFNPNTIDQYRNGAGVAHLVPWNQVWVAMFYNEDAYAAAGVSAPPATWNEWLDVNQQLADDGQKPYFVALKNNDAQTWWMITPMIEAMLRPQTEEINIKDADEFAFDPADFESTAGQTYTADELYVAFQKGIIDPAKSPGYRAAIETMLELQPYINEDASTVTNENDFVTTQFINGVSSQVMNGSFGFRFIDSELEKLPEPFTYAVTKTPTVTEDNFEGLTAGGMNPLAGVRNGWAVPSSNDDPDLAVDFLQYLTSADLVSKLYTEEAGELPPSDPSTVQNVEYPAQYPEVDIKQEFAEIPLYGFGGPPTFDSKDFDEFIVQWAQLWDGDLTVDEFLQVRSESNGSALERNLKALADQVDQGFIDRELE